MKYDCPGRLGIQRYVPNGGCSEVQCGYAIHQCSAGASDAAMAAVLARTANQNGNHILI
jgi:hypothetical protein